MAFSLRSFFGKEKSAETPSLGFTSSAHAMGQGNGSPGNPFQPAGNPFGGASIFKTVGAAESPGQPVASPFSPFSPAGAAGGLTVGDILPLLPQGVAKNPQLSPSQPLHLSDEVLERALGNGQAALPLFELYRVCPALFQTAVSPQDPRSVPLPPHKIASLLPAKHGRAGGSSSAAEPPAAQFSGTQATLFSPSLFGSSGGASEPPQQGGSQVGFGGGPANPFAPAGSGQPFAAGINATVSGGSASPFQPGTGHSPPHSPFMPAQAVTVSTGANAAPPAEPPSSNGGASSAPFGAPFQTSFQQPQRAGAFPSSTPQSNEGSNPFATAPTTTSNVSPFGIAAPSPPPVFPPAPAFPSAGAPALPPQTFAFQPAQEASPAAPTQPGAFWLQTPPSEPATSPPFHGQGTPLSQPAKLPSGGNGAFTGKSASGFVEQPSQPFPGVGSTPDTPDAAWQSIAPGTAHRSTALPPQRMEGSQQAPAFSPAPPTPGPLPNPFERIHALTKPVAPEPAFPPPASEHPAHEKPVATAFGASFDLPSAPDTAPSQPPPVLPPPLPFADGVSFGTPQPAGTGLAHAQTQMQPGERIQINLASALKHCTIQDIGISPDMIPSWVQASLPLSLVRAQLGASGSIKVQLSDIMAGLEPELRHLISPTRMDLHVDLPVNEVFQAVPRAASTAEKLNPLPDTREVAVHPPGPVTPDVRLPAGVPWPFAAESAAPEPMEPAPAPAVPPSSLFTTRPNTAPPPALPQPEPGLPLNAVVIPANPATGAPAHVSPAPVEPDAPARPPVAPRTGGRQSQLLLRALLGTQDDLDAQGIVRHTAGQPGVAAVVCLQEGRTVAISGNGSPEAENFLRQAQRIYNHVQPLVALTGIEDTETFSMKSDHQLVTFSLQGTVTLGILHDPGQNEPALREKVTLIARELTGLLQAA